MIEVRQAGRKGRGVFATRKIKAGERIECAPFIHIGKVEFEDLARTKLIHYVFEVSRDQYAVGLGFSSLYNHSSDANAEFDLFKTTSEIVITASSDIAKGCEILVDYGYDPVDPSSWDKYLKAYARAQAK